VPVQNALLNIILSGAFISSVPLAQDLQSQFPANMLKGEESFFPSSSGCYLGCSELRVVTEWCCPTWKNTQKKVPAFFFLTEIHSKELWLWIISHAHSFQNEESWNSAYSMKLLKFQLSFQKIDKAESILHCYTGKFSNDPFQILNAVIQSCTAFISTVYT
jgi:hypothetical protein